MSRSSQVKRNGSELRLVGLDLSDRKQQLSTFAIWATTLLAALYIFHTAIYIWFYLPNSRGEPAPAWLAYVTAPTGIFLIASVLWVKGRPLSQRTIDQWLGVLSLIVIANISIHYWTVGDIWVSSTYALVMIIMGTVIASIRWFVVLTFIAATTHALGSYLSPTIDSFQIILGISFDAISISISSLLFITRRAGLVNLKALRAETDQKQRTIENALAQAERTSSDMQQLIDRAPDAVLILFGKVIHYANAVFLESIRLPLEGVSGKLLSSLSIAGSVASSGPSRITFQRQDGESIIFQFSEVTNIQHDGKDATLIIGRDITSNDAELQAKLQLADRMAAIGVLASGVAHEINNPLTYVIGNLATMEDRQDSYTAAMSEEDRNEFLELVEESMHGAERVATIVRDLNALARSPVGEMKASIEQTLSSSLRIADPHLRFSADIVVELDSLPPVACCPSRLSQVFLNLIINAAHALRSEDGQQPTGSITIRGVRLDDSTVRVEIKDTGRGMDAETQRRLFEPFYTTKAVGDGTGLGLYYCINEITQIGGDLSFTSELGVGTTFVITLPIYKAETELLLPTTDSIELPELTILVIDDEPMVCKTIERMLEGQDITIVNDTVSAWKLMQQSSFDIIFCDLMMPGQTGQNFYVQVEQEMPQLSDHFIFITGGAFTPETMAFIEEKRDRVLQKPFQLQALQHSIEKLVLRQST